MDLSPTAVERAAAIAAAAGDEVAERIDWLQADLATWDLAERRFDLVSAQYVHLPSGRRQLWQRLAAAVTPGGSLLICGHHPSDLHTTMQRPHHPELYFTGADVLAALEPADWEIVTDAAPERTATAPDGHDVTIRDTVFHARRRT